MDDLTAALYVLFERLEQATDETDLEVRQKILRWAWVVFQLSSQCFIWWNTDLHNKKYNKWKFPQGFTFTHVQNFEDNDNRAKLRVINPSLAGTSL